MSDSRKEPFTVDDFATKDSASHHAALSSEKYYRDIHFQELG